MRKRDKLESYVTAFKALIDEAVEKFGDRPEVAEKLIAEILEMAKTVFDSDEYEEIERHAKSKLARTRGAIRGIPSQRLQDTHIPLVNKVNLKECDEGETYLSRNGIPEYLVVGVPVVKKTVAIHPILDRYVRRTWALLVEAGYDATYSLALNFMLLGAVLEAIKEGGWSEETREMVWDSFLKDRKAIEELNLEDMLANLKEYITPKHVTVEIQEKVKVKEQNVSIRAEKKREEDE